MTFLQLTFAVEVANSTSINKAAERLYTSQSNVSNSFFISSTVWQHPQHYDFTSIPLEENDDNILTHYYILWKGAHHPLTELYIEELKKMFGKL